MSLRIHDDEGHPGDWVPFVASWRISLTSPRVCAMTETRRETDRHAVRHFRRGDRLCPQCGDPIDGHVHKDEPDPLTAFLAWWDDALVNSPSLSINEMKWRIDTLRGTDA